MERAAKLVQEHQRPATLTGERVVQTDAVGLDEAFVGGQVYLLLKSENAIERIRARAADEDVERSDRPHQRIFQAELIPKITTDAPAFDIADEKKNQNNGRDRAREQTECKERPADKLGERDRRRPDFSRMIAGLVELFGQVGEVVRAHASIRKQAEGVAQAVRNEGKPDRGAQQRVGERQERLVK